ncbi:MAG: hypothetical protein H7Z15_22810 [Rhizobacter sp.]|nr:hypothetical protein [Rhizobacter sp.]
MLTIQVTPPGNGGVSDYAQCLQTEWATQGEASIVIALSKDLAAERPLRTRVGEQLGGRPAHNCSVVLHFSGYGYGHRGLCFWLLDEIAALRRDGVRLVVVFHELFASGPPWRSAFWVSHLQALIAARLARQANALWTNTEHHANWLRQTVGPRVPVRVRPVFSNVGELEAPPAVEARKPQAVVFGSASTRQRVFDALHGHGDALRRLGVESLVEVGSGNPSKQAQAGLPSQFLGRLDAADLGPLLQLSRFGLLDYPPQYLGKSGVFAAYASHGCVVLNTCRPGPGTDGLMADRHYLLVPAPAGARLGEASLDARAVALTRWYTPHSLPRQARELLALARKG